MRTPPILLSPEPRLARMARMLCVVTLAVLVGCASVPDPSEYDKPVSHALSDTTGTTLARNIREHYAPAGTQSGFFPLAEGMQAFVARMAVIAAAERSLDLQYYIWHGDTSGILLVGELLKAADRGVRVRLLLDDLDTQGKDAFLSQLDVHPSIEVRLFNPFAYRGNRGLGFLGDLHRLNHRMHNKSLTADNQATVVGGRNIGNEYFNAAAETTFADLDVLGIGPVVDKVSSMFDRYWNSDMVIPVSAFADEGQLTPERLQSVRDRFEQRVAGEMGSAYIRAIRDARVLDRFRLGEMRFLWGEATLVYDDPAKLAYDTIAETTHLVPQLAPMFDDADSEVVVVSPYFVPGDTLVGYFSRLADRGVRVRILTNSLAANDVGLVHAGYMRYRKALIRAGVELYEYKPDPSQVTRDKRWTGSSQASLHAKTMGADGEVLFVGSFNLDPRSVSLNTEMGVLIHNRELAQQLVTGFEQLARNQAYRVTLDGNELQWVDTAAEGGTRVLSTEPHTTWWQRFAAFILSVIVPESLL